MDCYNADVNKFDLVVANDSDFDLTYDRVYVVREWVGSNLIQIKNDTGKIDTYSTEYFRFYGDDER